MKAMAARQSHTSCLHTQYEGRKAQLFALEICVLNAAMVGCLCLLQALIVARGNCTFVQKTQMAVASGADALIVMNTLHGMYAAATNFR